MLVKHKMEEVLNLDLDNYSLDDILNLFHIPLDVVLTETLMKQAKRMTLNTHPDKSKMDSKIFLFFSKAYRKLYSVYENTNRLNVSKPNKFINENEEHEKEQLNSFFEQNPQLKKSNKKFNKWFNKEFLQCTDPLYLQEEGYGEWIKSNEEIPNEKISKANFNEYKQNVIESHNHNALICPFDNTLCSNSALDNSMALGNASKLPNNNNNLSCDYGTDLKEAWSENIIPVSETDMYKHQYNSVEAYKAMRNNTNTDPLAKEQAQYILQKKEQKDMRNSMENAYYYSHQEDKNKRKQDIFWSKIKQIKNN